MSAAAALRSFGLDGSTLLGGGGEAEVHALGDDLVLRIIRSGDAAAAERRRWLYDSLDAAAVPFAVPSVVDIGDTEGTPWSVERRLSGVDLGTALGRADVDRGALWDGYVSAASQIALIGVEPAPGAFGELDICDRPVRAPTWGAFLQTRARAAAERARRWLAEDVPRLDDLLTACDQAFAELDRGGPPALVHGDYFPENVLVDPATGTVSAVIDFSVQTVWGDPWMDLAFAAGYVDQSRNTTAEDVGAVRRRIVGSGVPADVIDLYLVYAALYYAFTRPEHPRLYAWCLGHLRRFASQD